MDFKTGREQRWDLYSPTPPLEAIKMQVALVARAQVKGNHGDPTCLLHSDVSRAYFNAPVKGNIYVMVPGEDDRCSPGWCGKLAYSMYGTREAATNWEDHYAEWLVKSGFQYPEIGFRCAVIASNRSTQAVISSRFHSDRTITNPWVRHWSNL